MIPGANLLGMAFQLINSDSAMYYQFKGESEAADGTRVNAFEGGQWMECVSIQPVDRDRYNELGLSFERSYYECFCYKDVQGVGRGYNGDVIEWNGRRYQVTGDTPWHVQDGWVNFMMIDIGHATGDLEQPLSC